MQRLEVSGAVRPTYGSLGVKGLMIVHQRKYSVYILGHFLSAPLIYELVRLPGGSNLTTSHKLLPSGILHSASSVAVGKY